MGYKFKSYWPGGAGLDSVEGESFRFDLEVQRNRLVKLATRPIFHSVLDAILCYELRELLSHLKHTRPRVIHYIGTGHDLIGLPVARLAGQLESIFTVWPAIHPSSWGDDRIDLRLYRRSTRVFCQSDFERRHLESLGVAPGVLVNCGLPPMCQRDGDGARFRSKLRLTDEPVVFFLGRLDRGKGYFALLDAWALVVGQIPNAQLIIAGPGEVRPSGQNVHDLGVVDEQEKADAYAACDVFCLPSRHESFGIVYVEAWSYGKPVICGEAHACRELVADGVNGLHSSQDSLELGASILQLLVSPSRRKTMGLNGRALQREKYSEGRMIDAHLAAWNLTAESVT